MKTPLAQRINTKRGETTYTGTITELRRATSSVNSNPAWYVYFESGFDSGWYRTQSDSMVSYEIDNSGYRGVPVTVALTKAGRIFAIEVAE
jgi:hypothetical protein